MSAAQVTESIRKLIAERSGLIVPERDFNVLRGYVSARMVATDCSDGLEYLALISEGANASSEFTQLVKLVTVGHTRFFRNPNQLAALRDSVLPALIGSRADTGSAHAGSAHAGSARAGRTRAGRTRAESERALRVLSAGCSTGEEPYSLAMLLLDEEERGACPQFEIVATDISPDALGRAKARVYSADALKYVESDFTERYMKRYCEVDGKDLIVGLAAASRVDFHQINILDYEPIQSFDIIFCRNVTIYFSQETSQDVLERMHGWLTPDGYMFAGAAESPSQVTDLFRPLRLGRSFAYVKSDGAIRKTASHSAATDVRDAARRVLERTAKRRNRSASTMSKAPEDGRCDNARLTKDRVPDPESAAADPPVPDAVELGIEAARWLAEKDYETAERIVRQALEVDAHDPGAQALLAQILANRGELDEAERVCREALTGDTLAPEAHFVMGCIHKEMSQTEEALADFQRCIYLDGDNSLAYFAVAGIHRQMGRDRDAQREYQNALLALSRRGERGEDVSGAITCWLPQSRATASGDVAMEGQDAD